MHHHDPSHDPSPVPSTEGKPGSRRAFIRAGAVGVAAVAIGATGSIAAAAVQPDTTPLPRTPAAAGHETPAEIEGPLFKPNSPQRTNLVTETIQGVFLDLEGVVYDTDTKPFAGALLDFWQCNQNGDYDTTGFSLRGHQFSAADGRYRLNTIIPRDYNGRWGQRTPHIHVKIQVPNGPLLVTQLYFPDDTRAYDRDLAALNAGDFGFNRALVITLAAAQADRYAGSFDFVIKTTA